MGLQWYTTVKIEGVETTPHDWLVINYKQVSAEDAAEFLSSLGLGSIGPSGTRRHLREKTPYRFDYEIVKGHHGRTPVSANGVVGDGHVAEVLGVSCEKVVGLLRGKGGVTLEALSTELDRSTITVEEIITKMQAIGYAIKRENRKVILPDTPALETITKPLFGSDAKRIEIAFGIVSDTHAGSHFEQITALHDFVKIAREEYGVKHILHPGDVHAGIGVYRGQQNEVYAYTAYGQAEAAANNLPYYSDLHWWMLGGNHDYSFFKLVGLDVRELLTHKGRDDITLLPYDAADLPLLPGVDARLWHASGGTAYALSYRGQKYAAQLAFDELLSVTMGEKPKPTVRVVLIGHFHMMFLFDQGPMIMIGSGGFEGQNGYLKRKGLIPHIGGWIVRCEFRGTMLHRITPERIRYREIEDDWRPWYTRRMARVKREREVMEPIFSLEEDEDGRCAGGHLVGK